jgi:hypothetical protein
VCGPSTTRVSQLVSSVSGPLTGLTIPDALVPPPFFG